MEREIKLSKLKVKKSEGVVLQLPFSDTCQSG